MATHHGSPEGFLYGDLDSGGWPKSPRDRVVEILRKCFALHINGDQHIPFLIQYGLDDCRDANWTFCTPAISAGYPRWFLPDELNYPVKQRPSHDLPNTGCYEDVFGNKNYVYAVGNPDKKFAEGNRYKYVHSKSSGFGTIDFDINDRKIKMNALRFIENIAANFPGWPHTINQMDNFGKEIYGYLPDVQTKNENALVKCLDEKGDLVYILRIKGKTFKPFVFEDGKYTIVIDEGNEQRELTDLEPVI